MKEIFVLFFLMLAGQAQAEILTLPIVSVVDGDTIKTKLPLPAPLDNVSIRILGIDTPEKGGKAKCEKEAALALKASAKTKEIAKGHKTMQVSQFKWDKFGGRIDAVVVINGVSVGDILINEGLARPYFGEKKSSWCE
jgi:micrococcal nuclease